MLQQQLRRSLGKQPGRRLRARRRCTIWKACKTPSWQLGTTCRSRFVFTLLAGLEPTLALPPWGPLGAVTHLAPTMQPLRLVMP